MSIRTAFLLVYTLAISMKPSLSFGLLLIAFTKKKVCSSHDNDRIFPEIVAWSALKVLHALLGFTGLSWLF